MNMLVVIGASMGGLDALRVLLAGLPADLPAPVIIVLHRGNQGGEALPGMLQERSALPVCEPDDKEIISVGRVYVAPPDYHLLVSPGAFALSTEPRVSHARPSIDVLFESAALAYHEGVVGVVLTGASRDGAEGAARIKERRGVVIVQDPATAEVPLMPAAALSATAVDGVLPLRDIAPALVSLLLSGR